MKKILDDHTKKQGLKKKTEMALAESLHVSELPPKPTELFYLKNVKARQVMASEDQKEKPAKNQLRQTQEMTNSKGLRSTKFGNGRVMTPVNSKFQSSENFSGMHGLGSLSPTKKRFDTQKSLFQNSLCQNRSQSESKVSATIKN